MSTYSITFDENRFGFLFDLFKNLNISIKKIKDETESDDFVPRTTEQLEADLRSALMQAKLASEGKIKLQTWDEFKKELAHEL
jgi:dTDP-4-dehydrorhamnose reductase